MDLSAHKKKKKKKRSSIWSDVSIDVVTEFLARSNIYLFIFIIYKPNSCVPFKYNILCMFTIKSSLVVHLNRMRKGDS